MRKRSNLLLTQEGRPCRSVWEAKYDAYLHWQNVSHRHEVRVPGLPYIADFHIGKYFVEIAGMMRFAKYHRKFDNKMGAYARAGLPVFYLFQSDVARLFDGCPLQLKYIKKRACSICSKETQDLVNKMCRSCNRKQWGRDNAVIIECVHCRGSFNRNAGSPEAKFCSRQCYWDSLKSNNPTLGALYMRNRRARQRETALMADFARN